MVAELNWPAIIAALASLVSAVAGCLMAYAAVVKARREATTEAEKECEEKLKVARDEAEKTADELHEARMRRGA